MAGKLVAPGSDGSKCRYELVPAEEGEEESFEVASGARGRGRCTDDTVDGRGEQIELQQYDGYGAAEHLGDRNGDLDLDDHQSSSKSERLLPRDDINGRVVRPVSRTRRILLIAAVVYLGAGALFLLRVLYAVGSRGDGGSAADPTPFASNATTEAWEAMAMPNAVNR